MIECPFCYRVFRQPPEKIGARCPKCKMPLYEDPSKKKTEPEKDFGKCAQHPDAPTVAKCSRCDAPVCKSCRTRWHQEVVCPQCVDLSLLEDEPSPQEAQLQTKQAWFAVVLSVFGWAFLFLTVLPFSTYYQGTVRPLYIFSTYSLFLGSFVLAAFAIGLAVAALRLRGDHRVVALSGLIASGLHVGLAIGLIVLNLWHN
jgi:hypothetical protein